MSEFKTKRWTVVQRTRHAWFGDVRTWVVYPPDTRRGGKVPPNRRFVQWERAIDYVFEQMGTTRWQSERTRQRQHSKVMQRRIESIATAVEILTLGGNHDG